MWHRNLGKGPRVTDMKLFKNRKASQYVRLHPVFGLYELVAYLVLMPSLFIFPPAFMIQACNIAAAIELSKGGLKWSKYHIFIANPVGLLAVVFSIVELGFSYTAIYLGSCFLVLLLSGWFVIKHQESAQVNEQ